MTGSDAPATLVSVLGRRRFGIFVLGQTVSQFGDKLTMMAMIGLVGATRGAASGGLALAEIAIVSSLPAICLGPLVGALVDRWNRRTTLFAADALRAVLVMLVPAVYAWTGRIEATYPIILVVFLAGMFFNAARMAMIPELVAPGDLLAANAVLTSVGRLATVSGIVGGGIVVGVAGRGWLGLEGYALGFYLDAASFWVSVATLVVSIPRAAGAAAPAAAAGAAGSALRPVLRAFRRFGAELREAWGVIRADARIGFAMLSFVALAAVGGIMYVVIVDVVQAAPGWGTRGVGVLGGVLAGGMVAGAAALGTVGARWSRPLTILGAGVLLGAVIGLGAGPFDFAFHAPMAFAGGALLAPMMVAQDTLLHETTPARFRGRVFAAKDLVLGAVFGAAALATGLAMMWLPPVGGRAPHEVVMLVTGPALAAAGAAGAWRFARRVGPAVAEK